MAADDGDPGGELSGSTGKSDTSSGSVWGSILGGLGSAAGNIIKAANTPKPKATKLPAWLVPVALGGVALLVVLVVVSRK